MQLQAMVVENEAIVALATEMHLRELGFDVILCPNGEKAINYIEISVRIDVAIIDGNLRDKSESKIIESLWEKYALTPVFISTGYIDRPPERIPGILKGSIYLLRKPWGGDDLKTALLMAGIRLDRTRNNH